MKKRCQKKRRRAEGSTTTSKLNFIYERDNAVCCHCGEHVPRSDASREHVKPIRTHPELARDISNQVLAHKGCNQ